MNGWTKEKIRSAIEAIHWDHELELIPKDIEFINNDEMIVIKNPNSNSVYANKVVMFDVTENVDKRIEDIFSFYHNLPFSWWVGSNTHPQNLNERLKLKGFKLIDTYIGLALSLDDWERKNIDIPYDIKHAETIEDIREHVTVGSEIWGYSDATVKSLINQRFTYVQMPSKRGGFIVVKDDKKGIAHSNWRYSHNGEILYLNGSGVLPSYRKRGVYQALISKRLNEAKEAGCKWVTVQARKGTSEPILRKLGFKKYETYEQYAKE
jgi:GNAT superfamily N-acetyltransferase